MVTIQELVDVKPQVGDIGIEEEVEGESLPSVNTTFWGTKDEDSLRNGGKEYYTKQPIVYKDYLPKVIKQLISKLDTEKYKIDKDSCRTSVHIHKNIQRDTPIEVMTVVFTYWLLENALFKYCGKDREGNGFCLRLKDAEGLLLSLENALNSKKTFNNLRLDNQRYSGQNLAAIAKFGSIEYRGMRGTLDYDTLFTWIKALMELTTKSKKFRTPSKLMDFYYFNGGRKLIEETIEDPMKSFLLKLPGLNSLIDDNANRLIDIAYNINWKNWEESLQKLNKKKRKVDSGDTFRYTISDIMVVPEQIPPMPRLTQ